LEGVRELKEQHCAFAPARSSWAGFLGRAIRKAVSCPSRPDPDTPHLYVQATGRQESGASLISRRAVSSVLILIALAGMLLALAMAFGATFGFHVGGLRVRASDPARPLMLAVAAAWAGALFGGPGRARRFGVCLGAVATTYVVALHFVRATAPEYAIGDAAVVELYTLHAARGVWPLGPYSRFGWHHPGPLYFYLLAPLYAAGGFRFVGINAGAAIINIASLTVVLMIVRRSASRSLVTWVPVVLGLYVLSLTAVFVSAWNPHVIVLPIITLVLVSAAVASGTLSLAPISIFIGSFCVQTHVATAPSVVVLWLFAFVAIAIQTRTGGIDTERARRWLNVAMWTGTVCWLLPLAEELQNRPGNMTAIFRFFHDSQQPHTFMNGIAIWAQMASGFITRSLTVPYARVLPVTPSFTLIALAIGQFVLLLFAAGFAIRTRRTFEASLYSAASLVSVAAVWSATRVTTAVEDHHVFWMSGIGALNWALLAGAATNGFVERLVSLTPQQIASVMYPVFALAVAYEPIRALGTMQRGAMSGGGIGREIKASADAITFDMVNHAFQRAIIRCGDEAWSEHAGVVVELYKRRAPVAVDEVSLFMFGQPLAVNGLERAQYVVHRTDAHTREDDRPGTEVLLRQANVTVTRRACTGPDFARPCLLFE
jgi:hypothetical protein